MGGRDKPGHDKEGKFLLDKQGEIYFCRTALRALKPAKAQAFRRFSRQPWVCLLLWGYGRNGACSVALQGGAEDLFSARLKTNPSWVSVAVPGAHDLSAASRLSVSGVPIISKACQSGWCTSTVPMNISADCSADRPATASK